MKLSNITGIATRLAGRRVLQIQKYSPQILTGVGIASGVAGAVVAAKQTLKLEPIIDEMEGQIAYVKNNHDENDSVKHLNREVTVIYARTSMKVVKLYGPAISLGVVSIGCTIGAQGIMHRRQAALIAAYTTVERTLSEYRKRVEEAFGEEREAELYHNITLEKGKDADKNDVTGIKGKRKDELSGYTRFFDEFSPAWQKNPEYNKFFLTSKQNYWNDRLKSRGHVFLNEIYDELGLERSKAGQIVGWVYNKDNKGDNYIDFGMYRNGEMIREFVNGREASILLDFNVDGPIIDLI